MKKLMIQGTSTMVSDFLRQRGNYILIGSFSRMSNYKISVIVPVYNCAKYLDQGITSLIEQTHHNLEIILIDDCSTDESLSILEKYEKKDQRVRLIKMKHNSGVSVCRNAGLDAATGDYVAFMDADDWYEKDAMKVMLNAMKEDAPPQGSTVLCVGRFYDDFNGKSIERPIASENIKLPNSKNELIDHPEIFLGLRIEIWGRLFRNDGILTSLRFLPGLTMAQDSVFMAELMFNVDKIFYVDKPLYHYRILEQSAYHGVSKRHATIVNGKYRRWKKTFEQHGVIDKIKPYFFNYIRTDFIHNLKLTPPTLQPKLLEEIRLLLLDLNIQCPSRFRIAMLYLTYKSLFIIKPLKDEIKAMHRQAIKVREFYKCLNESN